jgi:hypothetical protein
MLIAARMIENQADAVCSSHDQNSVLDLLSMFHLGIGSLQFSGLRGHYVQLS